jgi:hypothetical protein
MRRRTLLPLVLALATTVSCAASLRPFVYAKSDAHSTSADGLYRIKSWSLKGAVFVRPESSLAGYHSLHIDPVGVAYKGGEERPGMSNRMVGNFKLEDDSMERLHRIIEEAFEGQLGKSQSFTGQGAPGPGVLQISIFIVELVVKIPPHRIDERNFRGELGEMTLVAEARDSQSGEVLLRLVDRRAVLPNSAMVGAVQETNTVTSWGAVRDLAAEWSKTFRQQIDTLHAFPAPAMPSPSPAG